MADVLVPALGCVVLLAEQRELSPCLVVQVDSKRADGVWVQVQHPKDQARSWLRLDEVRCGFARGMSVQHVPLHQVEVSLGEGRVEGVRSLGGCEQVLVEFYDSGRRLWLPYETLRHIKSARERFYQALTNDQEAERFRLRTLALMLERWHENTGALARLEIDPLPHQLQLVHHILSSGNFNWLIADDVGLGKTIEVGMLLSALLSRAEFNKVLIVTPSGLTTQWQEEMSGLFGLDDFRIYGRDFEVNNPEHWGMYPRVIASMDRLKRERDVELLRSSGRWDMVVFDEGHRLARRLYGTRIKTTERYELARFLRTLTGQMLLLSATPHQGKQDAFVSLLNLLRPEWSEYFESLSEHGALLRQMIYRNRKIDVTDAQGNFIFKGQTSRLITLERGEQEEAFDALLQQYLKQGYERAAELGVKGQAISFVMTVYRKLAASSHAAILNALVRRKARLLAEADELQEALDAFEDERFASEALEAKAQRWVGGGAFFDGEVQTLEVLIGMAQRLCVDDKKLAAFEVLLGELLKGDPERRVLLFTEFKGTQEHLAEALSRRVGAQKVEVIHGGQSLDDRRRVVAAFNEGEAQFLISTEAGGEGLNLQRRCFTMVNYDLPWNPMRMVQRMGRLYRYGQPRRVEVYNFSYGQTLDARVVELIYERLSQVVADMGHVSDEYHDRLDAEILGEVASLLDVSELLRDDGAQDEDEQRTKARIDEALERARNAQQLQEDILGEVMRFDPEAFKDELELDKEHLVSFVEGMLRQLGCVIEERAHEGQVLTVRLSDAVVSRLGWRKTLVRVTAHRELHRRVAKDVEVLDMKHPLFRLMLSEAQSHHFGGLFAVLRVEQAWAKALVVGRLRWQDNQGVKIREDVVTASLDSAQQVRLNPAQLAAWLKAPARAGAAVEVSPTVTKAVMELVEEALDKELAQRRSAYLHPLQRHILAAAWVR